jgi:uncharacterized membrane protein required for colicin V production
MVSLTVIFWMYIILFGIIGAMRGWAKEILVSFSVILSLFMITLLEQYVPPLQIKPGGLEPGTRFWVRTFIVGLSVFFGYQSPNLRAIAGARFARERLQDTMLGLILGMINGYLIVGTLWFFMDAAGYPFQPLFTPPDPATEMGKTALALIKNLPPVFLGPPWIYFAVAVAFLFVVVVFI